MSSLQRAAARSMIHRPAITVTTANFCSGEKGSGVGHGGGAGGTVRESGGSMGKRAAVQEEQYFRKKQAEQLDMMKKHLADQIMSHEKLIKQHEQEIQKSKDQIKQLMKSDQEHK